MSRERLYYAILWIIAVVAISIPWLTVDEEVYIGWNFLFPFSFTYLIGLIMGLVVLITKAKPFVLSLVAGILMIIGVFGGFLGIGAMELVGELPGDTVSCSYGIGIAFAFIWSVVYTVGASAFGTRMVGK